MNDATKHRLRLGLAAGLLIVGVGLIVAGRGADDLHRGAGMIAKWDDRRASRRMPRPEEIAALPGESRALFLSQQNKEAGDLMGLVNHYAEQAEWFRDLADERAARRDCGIGLVGLSVVWLSVALWLEKAERRRAAVFE